MNAAPHVHDFTFLCGDETLAATIDHNAARDEPSILSLHGGGPEGRQRIAPLARFLAAHGHSVLRVDHVGWGDSSGDRFASSLSKRVDEALAACQCLASNKPVTLIATSMGGHVALELLPRLNVESLILFCPAAYAAEAFDVPFGPDFTAIIRRPDSYNSATVFAHLQNFTGGFLMVNGTGDPVIPGGVIEHYEFSTRQCTPRNILKLDGAPHNIMGWLAQHADQQARVFQIILSLYVK